MGRFLENKERIQKTARGLRQNGMRPPNPADPCHALAFAYISVVMRIITRYILRYLGVGAVTVSMGLACVVWLSQSLRFIELIAKNNLPLSVFINLIVLLLPNVMVIVLPIAVFVATLFTYTRLGSDREMIVLKAAGASYLQLGTPAFILGMVATLVCFALTLYGVPKSVERFRERQGSLRNDVSAILLQEGMFTEVARGLTVYVRSRSPEGELLGLLIHDERKASHTITLMAERGALVFGENGPRVLMVNGNQQEVKRGKDQLSILYFDSYSLDIGRLHEANPVRFRDARERGLRELLTISEDAGLSAMDVRRFRIEAHQRLSLPLFNLGFVALALVFLLPAPFNRRGQTRQMIAAVGSMVMIEAAALGIANLATRHLGVVAFLYVLAVLPLGWAFCVLGVAPRLCRGRGEGRR